jgi:nucleoside-diphosphate-sugar epimerase
MESEKVLLTGASGFIGAALARALLAAGHEVHALVRSPATAWRLHGLGGLQVHEADLRDGRAIREMVRSVRPKQIYHAAAHGTMAGQRDSQAILTSNLLGTANLLDALEGQDFERLVNVGSSSEYGHVDGPIVETAPLAPRTTYGVAKAAATLLCQARALAGWPICTVRIFSAYGPWEDPTRLASSVLATCLQGVRPRLTAGWQPRDFIFIDDVVDLLKVAASHPAAIGQVLHAGTGRPQTVRDLVEAIMKITGLGLAPDYGAVPMRSDEPKTWVASIERTEALTGWRPRIFLDEGAQRLLAWFQAQAGVRAA